MGASFSQGPQIPCHCCWLCSPTRVDPDVPLQSARVCKLPLAMDTHIGLLPTVDPEVPLKVPCRETKGKSGTRAPRDGLRSGERVISPGAPHLPEVVNCFPHSRHLRGPSAMWIFRWALRFPTCAQNWGGSEE